MQKARELMQSPHKTSNQILKTLYRVTTKKMYNALLESDESNEIDALQDMFLKLLSEIKTFKNNEHKLVDLFNPKINQYGGMYLSNCMKIKFSMHESRFDQVYTKYHQGRNEFVSFCIFKYLYEHTGLGSYAIADFIVPVATVDVIRYITSEYCNERSRNLFRPRIYMINMLWERNMDGVKYECLRYLIEIAIFFANDMQPDDDMETAFYSAHDNNILYDIKKIMWTIKWRDRHIFLQIIGDMFKSYVDYYMLMVLFSDGYFKKTDGDVGRFLNITSRMPIELQLHMACIVAERPIVKGVPVDKINQSVKKIMMLS